MAAGLRACPNLFLNKSDLDNGDKEEIERIRHHEKIGRPLGSEVLLKGLKEHWKDEGGDRGIMWASCA